MNPSISMRVEQTSRRCTALTSPRCFATYTGGAGIERSQRMSPRTCFSTAVRTAGDPHSVSIGWLIRVARNRLIDVMRRQARLSDKLGVIHDRAVELDIHLDAAVVDRLIVVEALRRLSIDHRIVLTLHYLDGYSAPALAEELGRSVRSVEGLLFRAREGLRRELVSNDA